MADPTAAERRAQQQIAARLGEIGFALPGTLLERYMACGKTGCRCQADPPQLHGPYHQWTRRIAGKTRTRRLTDHQAATYGPWFENAHRIRELTAELEALSLHIFERHEGPT